MSSLDNLVAEILEQAKKEASRMLTKAKAENLEFFEKENKKYQKGNTFEMFNSIFRVCKRRKLKDNNGYRIFCEELK